MMICISWESKRLVAEKSDFDEKKFHILTFPKELLLYFTHTSNFFHLSTFEKNCLA
jgi:hypothetical protein